MKLIARRALLLRLLLIVVLACGVLLRAGFLRGNHQRQNEALFHALEDSPARTPNPAEVRRLLKEGADPNARRHTATPLPVAVFLEHPKEAVTVWYQTTVRRQTDETALLAAVSQGDYGGADDTAAALTTLLLNRGADVNGRSGGGGTALINASALGNDKALAVLLNRGANIDLQDDRGRTALMSVVHVSTARLLLAQGANVNLRDREGKTALTYAENLIKSEVPPDTALLQVLEKAGGTR